MAPKSGSKWRRNVLILMAALLVVVALVGVQVARAKRVFDEEPATDKLAKLHPPPGPCLRWSFGDVDYSAAPEVARAIHQAGIPLERYREVVGVFAGWTRERELSLHGGKSEVDEFGEVVATNLYARIYFRLYRHKFEQAFDMSAVDAAIARSQPHWDALDDAKKALLRQGAKDHPELFDIGGALRVLRELEGLAVADRVQVMGTQLKALKENGADPKRAFEDAAQQDPKSVQDPWGGTLRLVEEPQGLVLVSYGADQFPGGEGLNRDALFVVAPSEDAGTPSASPAAPPVECPALPHVVAASRREIDAALGDLNKVAVWARIVPSFEEGKAVGFKLFRIAPDSGYAKIGLCDGDVVLSVNGQPLRTPDEALRVEELIRREKKRFDVRIRRGGSEGMITVKISR